MSNFQDSAGFRGEYTLTITRPDGSKKPVFQYNSFGSWILKTFGVVLDIPYITGRWSDEFTVVNTIVNDGLAESANLVGAVSSASAFEYLALGSDSTSVSNSDSSLGSEFTSDGLSRTSATKSREQTNVTDDTLKLENTFTYSGSTSTSVEELGVFNASSGGEMLSRSLTGGKTVDTNGETVDVTYKLIADRA